MADLDQVSGYPAAGPAYRSYASPHIVEDTLRDRPDLRQQYNPLMNITTGLGIPTGYENADPRAGRAPRMMDTSLEDSGLLSQQAIGYRREMSRMAARRDDAAGLGGGQREQGQEQDMDEAEAPREEAPAVQVEPFRQPDFSEGQAFARSPVPPMGTHQIAAYTSSGPIRTPGTRSFGTSYDAYGR